MKRRQQVINEINRLCNGRQLDYGELRVIDSALARNVALYWPSWWWKLDYARVWVKFFVVFGLQRIGRTMRGQRV